MFKFVLCALLAVAVAEPGVLLTPSLYSQSYLAPPVTTITRHASSVVNTPLYPYGISHYIKKRSVPVVSSYVAPYVAPWVNPYSSYGNPLYPYSPIDLTGAHFIKKRSAAVNAYIHPSIATTYTSALLHDYPLYPTFGLSHLIKKRSAVWAPSTYVGATPFASTYLGAPAVLPADPYWSTYAAGLPFIKK